LADSNNRKAKTRPISMFGFRTVTGSPTHKPSVSNNSRGKASSSPRAPPAPAAALAEEGKGSTRVTRPRGGVCWPAAARDRAEGSAGQRQHAAARRRRRKATAARHGAGRRQHAAARRRRRKAAARSRRSARPAGIRSAAPPRSARPAGRRPPRRAPAFPPCSGVPSTRRLLVTGAGAVQDSPSAPVRGPTRRFALREQATHICLLIRPERKLGATFASFVGGCFANPNALCGTHFAFASRDGFCWSQSIAQYISEGNFKV